MWESLAGGLLLRTELARLNGDRPLQDGLLGAGPFDSALEAIHDLVTIEADLRAKSMEWRRPPPPPTFGRVKGLIGARGRAVHAARNAPVARAATGAAPAGAAHPSDHAAPPGTPPGPPASGPFAAGGLPVYGASSKLTHTATSTLAVDASVIAPLLTRAALAAEFAATPLPNAIPEAERLYSSFGNAAIAFHISSGAADAPTSGEHLPLSLHTSRVATWKRTLSLVAAQSITPELDMSKPVAGTVSSLTSITCAAFTPLLGGHAVTKKRADTIADIMFARANLP